MSESIELSGARVNGYTRSRRGHSASNFEAVDLLRSASAPPSRSPRRNGSSSPDCTLPEELLACPQIAKLQDAAVAGVEVLASHFTYQLPSWGAEGQVLGARAPTNISEEIFTMGGHPQSFDRKSKRKILGDSHPCKMLTSWYTCYDGMTYMYEYKYNTCQHQHVHVYTFP